jgi:hypothetical protein
MTALLGVIAASPAYAIENMNDLVPKAQKVGEAKLRVMLWDIYDATLFAPNGEWSFEKPFVLQLKYLHSFKGEKIADRSVQEIRGQGFDGEVKLAMWHTQMRNIFPDVAEGDVISGVYNADGSTVFYKGDERIGRILDPEFSHQFFAIWLSPKTSEPEMRLSLLGQTHNQGKNDHENSQNNSSYGDHNND